MKKRKVSYSLYEIVFAKQLSPLYRERSETIFEWLTPTEFAALKRSKKWKDKISSKKLSTITINLSL